MQSSPTTPPRRNTKRWLTIGAAIIVAIIGYFIVTDQLNQPRDLGSQLEYIGKTKGDCAPSPFSFLCFGEPYHVYYFASNMNEDELKNYLKNANYSPPDTGGSSIDSKYKWLHFIAKDSQKDIVISHYEDTKAEVERNRLKKTNKPYIYSITSSDYDLVKQSL